MSVESSISVVTAHKVQDKFHVAQQSVLKSSVLR